MSLHPLSETHRVTERASVLARGKTMGSSIHRTTWRSVCRVGGCQLLAPLPRAGVTCEQALVVVRESVVTLTQNARRSICQRQRRTSLNSIGGFAAGVSQQDHSLELIEASQGGTQLQRRSLGREAASCPQASLGRTGCQRSNFLIPHTPAPSSRACNTSGFVGHVSAPTRLSALSVTRTGRRAVCGCVGRTLCCRCALT